MLLKTAMDAAVAGGPWGYGGRAEPLSSAVASCFGPGCRFRCRCTKNRQLDDFPCRIERGRRGHAVRCVRGALGGYGVSLHGPHLG